MTARGWCASLGLTFAQADLHEHFRIWAPLKQIKRLLKRADPERSKERAKDAAATKYEYNVKGPRSLYHCDAHEKLAKIWGIWIHLCIEGYSRKIIYLKVSTDKLASTVGEIFVEACNDLGWASRVRWDKGSENAEAIEEQIKMKGPGRGSALTGVSTKNCRAEYIWPYVKKHIVTYFRALFIGMETTKHILDPDDPVDLFCLHAVFFDMVQDACDCFRRIWNGHRIRGKRTVNGHGGGVPNELFMDPMEEGATRDSEWARDPNNYGAADPHRGIRRGEQEEEERASWVSKNTRDPLAGWEELSELRAAYFRRLPLDPKSDGVADFLRFRDVCTQLLCAVMHFGAGAAANGAIDEIDWVAFMHADGLSTHTQQLRSQLAWLAGYEGL